MLVFKIIHQYKYEAKKKKQKNNRKIEKYQRMQIYQTCNNWKKRSYFMSDSHYHTTT